MEKGRQYLWSSRMLGLLGVLLAGGLLHSEPAYAQSACDTYPSWPQVAHDAQRTGKSPENLGQPGVDYDKDGNGRIEYHGTNQTINDVAWRHAFQPDKVFPQVQAIVYCGKVFVGTEGANGQPATVYALNAQTGVEEWKYQIPGTSILASVAAGDGKVFFDAMNGTVYALNAQTGVEIWKVTPDPRHGFSTAPVFADNKVMLGGRNGKFYAFNKDTGAKIWERDIDAPILQTAAYNVGSDSKKRVFVGGMDMYLYALDVTNSGTVLWKSKVKGMAMKDYWPVVHRGKVWVYPMVDHRVEVTEAQMPSCTTSSNNCDITLRIFDETTGQETATTITHANVPLHDGTMTPPCVSKDNNLIVSAGGSWSEVHTDPASSVYGKIADTFIDSAGENGYNNTDETMNVSCAQNSIIAIHHNGSASCGSGRAGFSGVFSIPSNKWTCYVPGRVSDEMGNNTQGGGGNPASIANGIFLSYSKPWHYRGEHELIKVKAQNSNVKTI